MKEKNSCFGYTRVSTVKQGEGVSLEAQKQAIEAFAKKNDLNIIKGFEEKETAAKKGRPVFSAMIKELHQGKAANLIIHKIDRSARNLADWAKIGELSDAGINVHFATESLDFRSRGGRLTADIQAVIAADYVRNLTEEQKKGTMGRLKQGLYPYKAPTGYVDNGAGKPKTPCPQTSPYIKQLFELYATGQYSMESLSQEMYRRGLRSTLGKRIYKSKIDRILCNPFYVGIIKIQTTGFTTQGIHQPIVSTEIFNRVADVRNGRVHKKQTRHNLLYRSLMTCATCSRTIIGEKQRGHVYYRCHTRACGSKTIREEVIDRAVVNNLSCLQLSETAIAQLTSKIMAAIKEKNSGDTAQPKQIKLAEIATQKEKLLDALLAGIIDKTTYQNRQQQLLLLENEHVERQQKIQSDAEIKANITKTLEHLKNVASTYLLANSSEKRQMLEILNSNIVIESRKPILTLDIWVVSVFERNCVPHCGLSKNTDRSSQDMQSLVCIENDLPKLHPRAKRFIELCDQIKSRIPKS